MSDCCDNNSTEVQNTGKNLLPRKFNCPVNEQQYIEVTKKTILQHIKSPWERVLTEKKYYFCDDPDCDVVYFGIDGSTINTEELRTRIGKKDPSNDLLVCYCFGVSKSLAMTDPDIKKYVTQQTKENNCACEIRNPSGRCCLKDFPKHVQ